jgi:hypothetical protein
MKTVKIYILRDPITNQIRYVGKTIGTLKQRLSNHLSSARSGRYNNYTTNWLKSLINKDLNPKIELVEESIDLESWENLEKTWIGIFKNIGCNLTNSTEGGIGNQNQYFSKDSQIKKSNSLKAKIRTGEISYKEKGIKISAALKGIKRSEATKEKLRQANLGKIQPREIRLKQSLAVIQLTLNGVFIKEWEILSEASRNLNISKGAISNVCKGKQKTAGSFKWQYKNEDIV